MKTKNALIIFAVMIAIPSVSFCQAKPVVPATALRIDVAPLDGRDEKAARLAVNKALKETSALDLGKVSQGYAIDRAVAVLKECGIKNAFVSLGDEMYCMGRKSDKEMWKAWIPHPTDKNKKVFAILRLEDKAIATVHNDLMSASVVADDTVSAERIANDLLARGHEALKSADERGLDALVIVKDGNKFKTEMAGGFKLQYEKFKK